MKTKTELLTLLGEDRLEEIFQEFSAPNIAQTPKAQQVLLLQSRWHDLKNQEIAGITSRADLDVGYAQVRQGLHHVLTLEPPTEQPAQKSAASWFWPVALVGALMIGLASAWFALNTDIDTQKAAKEDKKRLEELVKPVITEETKPTNSASAQTAIQLQLPENRVATFTVLTNQVRYELLSAQIEPANDAESLVQVQVKCSNKGAYPINFWNKSFRMACNGNNLAPSGSLNAVVELKSDHTGILEFMIPAAATSFDLVVMNQDMEKVFVLKR
jgi:Effector-associated domain 11